MKFQDKSHWTTALLSDVAEIIGGGTPDTTQAKYWNGDINWFTPTEIVGQKYVNNSKRKITKLGVANSSARILPKNSILLSSRATLGEMSILKSEACTNQGFQSLIIKPHCDVEYIYYLQHKIMEYMLHWASGSTFLEISKKHIAKIPIPLPPLEEQKEIAHILSKQDEYIDKLNQLIQAKEKNFLGLIQTLITDRVNEWDTVQASNIMDIRDGTHDSPILLEKGVQFVTSKNIKNFSIDFENVSYISLKDSVQINKRSAVEQDDILFSMIGTIGEIALIDFKPNFCIKNVGLFKHNKQKILPYFLLNYFQTSLFKKMILKLLNGGIQKFLSLGALRKLQIPLPPLEEQERIAKILSIAQSEISKLKELKSKHQQQKLALMQEIFG